MRGNDLMSALAVIVNNRHLLRATVAQGLKARTTANVLGAVWLILYPLLFLTLYTLVFVHILQVRLPDMSTSAYVLTIFCGLVPFLAFSEAFGLGTVSLISNRGLLRNTMFPVELVVAKEVLVAHASMAVGLVIVWLACLYAGHLYWSHLAFPVVFFLQVVMTLGLVWMTAALTVFFRDLQQATPIIVLILMLISPIAYTEEMVPQGLKSLLDFNPLAHFMSLYRSVLMEGRLPLERLAIVFAMSLTSYFAGYAFITRLKPLFVDHV